MKKNCNAFTLAEVLIVLAIIGVVAAITLPSLVANYQKQEYVTGLKVAYSQIDSAFKMQIARESVTDLADTSFFQNVPGAYNSAETSAYLKEQIPKMFKTVKLCDTNDSTCNFTHKTLNGDATYSNNSYFKFNLNNSMLVKLYVLPKSSWVISNNRQQGEYELLGQLEVDVNGEKGPNVLGRDDFMFDIKQNGIEPQYSNNHALFAQSLGLSYNNNYWKTASSASANCSTSGSSYGYACDSRIIENGWTMDY